MQIFYIKIIYIKALNYPFQVMQRQFLRSGKILATFKLDIATVMQQPGERHEQG